MRDRGMNSRVGGTRQVRKIPIPTVSPHLPAIRAGLNAAGTAGSTVMTMTAAPTSSVYHKDAVNRVFP